MTLALCVMSFTFGLLAIDMFCDHYVFVGSSMTTHQIETCSSYYRNAAQQPPYMSLVTALPILLGIIAMIANFRRSIFDKISIPLFFVVVGIFVLRVKPNVDSVAKTFSLGDKTNETYLREIAYNHAIMSGILVVLIILQLLAKNSGRGASTSSSKKRS